MAEELADPKYVLHVRQPYDDPMSEKAWSRWFTTEDLDVEAGHMITVQAEFETDLVSVPNVASWFVPVAGQFARAAVMHDHLWKLCDIYRTKKRDSEKAGTEPPEKPEYDRRQADEQFRIALEKAGVSLLRRHMLWAAVRMAAIAAKHDPGANWEKDIPALILIGAVAIPILAPPAVVIWLSNRAFYGLDHVVAKYDKSKNPATLQTWT